jgi:hypothetical protein
VRVCGRAAGSWWGPRGATRLSSGEHATVYAMAVTARVPVAMVLPVPVREGLGDQGLRFLDLSGYSRFFKDLDALFPRLHGRGRGKSLLIGSRAVPLKVHRVGAFVASYVPTEQDFDRLDPQFRVPAALGDLLFPRYPGWGYAVFQLAEDSLPQKVHPMAYAYQPRDLGRLFYPTVHVHDGRTVPEREHFDHTLYTQSDVFPCGWESGPLVPGQIHLDLERTQGLVRAEQPFHRIRIHGVRPNRDLVLLGPPRPVLEDFGSRSSRG